MELIHFHNPSDIALIDADKHIHITYAELIDRIKALRKTFEDPKFLAFLFIKPTIESLITYLALLDQGHAVVLFDNSLGATLRKRLIDFYCPQIVIEPHTGNAPHTEELQIWKPKNKNNASRLHPELQLLLSTSGTTGSPKLIRLSMKNILSNASSIVEYLKITPHDNAIASLPFSYSYGLSVLHSHLMAGACVTLTSQSIVQASFWDDVETNKCTSMAGVPYMYQLLDGLDLETLLPHSVKTLTQAGGRLDPSLAIKLHEMMSKRNGKFIPMYGQTEATARIAFVPSEYLPSKAGSIGIPIPGGKLQIFDGNSEITQPNAQGELVYSGNNVMMGYAIEPSDLALGDELHGTLRTGDIGYHDIDGFYYLTGRLKRISKVYGQRINLDEIEDALSEFGKVAVVSDDICIRIYFERNDLDFDACVSKISKMFRISSTTFECISIPQLPLTVSGKIDYTQLMAEK